MTESVIALISAAAVVISLIFEGFEPRQARQLAIADQMNYRMNVIISFIGIFTAANLDFLPRLRKLQTTIVFSQVLKKVRGIY